jgi:hypothetical protein
LKWVFWGVWVGSYVVKKIYEPLKFLSKVEQCSTFEGEKQFKFGVAKKNYVAPIFLIYGQFGQLPKNIKNKILNFLLH